MRKTNKRKKRISVKLKKIFNPTFIEIIDNSLAHSGHGGFDKNAKETHLYIKMKSLNFKKMNKREMHQSVYSELKSEFSKGLHALELELDIE